MNHEERRAAVDDFYALLEQLGERAGAPRPLGDVDGADCPESGVYFFFEPGEYRQDGLTLRVTRVGTHAISGTSQTTLWNRLRTHRGTLGGGNPGGGNHRGSVFRLHVGNALIARDGHPEAAGTWGQGSSVSAAEREPEEPLERAVSAHIRAMPVLWVSAPDRDDRRSLERGSISLPSNHGRSPVDPPSPRWLGHYAASAEVRESGLWNINHVDEPADSSVPRRFERLLAKQ